MLESALKFIDTDIDSENRVAAFNHEVVEETSTGGLPVAERFSLHRSRAVSR
jgi:hypothetical protein